MRALALGVEPFVSVGSASGEAYLRMGESYSGWKWVGVKEERGGYVLTFKGPEGAKVSLRLR